MNREYHCSYSEALGRDMELLVFGHSGAKVIVFPTRDGRFHEYEDLGIVQTLASKIESGQMQLFCVDSIDHDSFYCNWKQPADRIRRHIQFEEYILDEVFPFMESKNDHECTIAHGCSLGAYHAGNIALRHPHRFNKLVAFSGRFDLTESLEWFNDLFDGYYDENIYYHTPSHFLPNLERADALEALRRMEVILVVGEEDPFLGSNRLISEQLWQKGAANRLEVWRERAHRGYYWRRMAPIYL